MMIVFSPARLMCVFLMYTIQNNEKTCTAFVKNTILGEHSLFILSPSKYKNFFRSDSKEPRNPHNEGTNTYSLANPPTRKPHKESSSTYSLANSPARNRRKESPNHYSPANSPTRNLHKERSSTYSLANSPARNRRKESPNHHSLANSPSVTTVEADDDFQPRKLNAFEEIGGLSHFQQLRKTILRPTDDGYVEQKEYDGILLRTDDGQEEIFVPKDLIQSTQEVLTKIPRTLSPIKPTFNTENVGNQPSSNFSGRKLIRRHVTGQLFRGMPFSFQYIVDDEATRNYQTRQEAGDVHGVVRGCYQVLEPTGIVRTVTYRADFEGFRIISTTKSSDKVPCSALSDISEESPFEKSFNKNRKGPRLVLSNPRGKQSDEEEYLGKPEYQKSSHQKQNKLENIPKSSLNYFEKENETSLNSGEGNLRSSLKFEDENLKSSLNFEGEILETSFNSEQENLKSSLNIGNENLKTLLNAEDENLRSSLSFEDENFKSSLNFEDDNLRSILNFENENFRSSFDFIEENLKNSFNNEEENLKILSEPNNFSHASKTLSEDLSNTRFSPILEGLWPGKSLNQSSQIREDNIDLFKVGSYQTSLDENLSNAKLGNPIADKVTSQVSPLHGIRSDSLLPDYHINDDNQLKVNGNNDFELSSFGKSYTNPQRTNIHTLTHASHKTYTIPDWIQQRLTESAKTRLLKDGQRVNSEHDVFRSMVNNQQDPNSFVSINHSRNFVPQKSSEIQNLKSAKNLQELDNQNDGREKLSHQPVLDLLSNINPPTKSFMGKPVIPETMNVLDYKQENGKQNAFQSLFNDRRNLANFRKTNLDQTSVDEKSSIIQNSEKVTNTQRNHDLGDRENPSNFQHSHDVFINTNIPRNPISKSVSRLRPSDTANKTQKLQSHRYIPQENSRDSRLKVDINQSGNLIYVQPKNTTNNFSLHTTEVLTHIPLTQQSFVDNNKRQKLSELITHERKLYSSDDQVLQVDFPRYATTRNFPTTQESQSIGSNQYYNPVKFLGNTDFYEEPNHSFPSDGNLPAIHGANTFSNIPDSIILNDPYEDSRSDTFLDNDRTHQLNKDVISISKPSRTPAAKTSETKIASNVYRDPQPNGKEKKIFDDLNSYQTDVNQAAGGLSKIQGSYKVSNVPARGKDINDVLLVSHQANIDHLPISDPQRNPIALKSYEIQTSLEIADNHQKDNIENVRNLPFTSSPIKPVTKIQASYKIVNNPQDGKYEKDTILDSLIKQPNLGLLSTSSIPKNPLTETSSEEAIKTAQYINSLRDLLLGTFQSTQTVTPLQNTKPDLINFPFVLVPITSFLELRKKGYLGDGVQGYGAVIQPT